MKKFSKIIIGIFTFAILFTLVNVNTVLATPQTPTEIPAGVSEAYQYQVLANHSHTWRFQLQTRVTVQANISIQGFINCKGWWVSFSGSICRQVSVQRWRCHLHGWSKKEFQPSDWDLFDWYGQYPGRKNGFGWEGSLWVSAISPGFCAEWVPGSIGSV